MGHRGLLQGQLYPFLLCDPEGRGDLFLRKGRFGINGLISQTMELFNLQALCENSVQGYIFKILQIILYTGDKIQYLGLEIG
jgi:hypothetical protein